MLIDVDSIDRLFAKYKSPKKKRQEAFDNGFKMGREAGIKEGMNLRLSQTRGLTEEEYAEVIQFLKERNLVLTYSATYGNGFAVRVDCEKDPRPFRTVRATNITFLTNQ